LFSNVSKTIILLTVIWRKKWRYSTLEIYF